jgi:hypothetical protein
VDHFVAFLFIFPVLPYPVRPANTDTPELQRIVARLLEDNVICPKIIRLRRDIISKVVALGTDSYIPARLKDGIPIIPNHPVILWLSQMLGQSKSPLPNNRSLSWQIVTSLTL